MQFNCQEGRHRAEAELQACEQAGIEGHLQWQAYQEEGQGKESTEEAEDLCRQAGTGTLQEAGQRSTCPIRGGLGIIPSGTCPEEG